MTMIDVFVCVFEKADVEEAAAVIAGWNRYKEANVKVLTPATEEVMTDMKDWIKRLGVKKGQFMVLGGVPVEDFQRMRRVAAETLSKSEVYVVTDSDCMPMGEEFVVDGLKIMAEYKSFGMLSAMPENATIVDWTPEDREVVNDSFVMEHINTGNIRFIRKGAMPEEVTGWKEQTDNRRDKSKNRGWKYDHEHCGQMREREWRVGYMRNVKMQHLGEGRY